MTSTIAFIGKSGSGKTTLAKAFLQLIRNKFPNSTVLVVDNDLSLELSESFGVKTRNTIYGIKSGKHEYKTGIPEGMSKQEYIEWALEDIIIEVEENVDVIASWFVTPKDCICPSTKLMRDSVSKLIERYDFVIFDCEYDLKYLNLLADYPIDETIIVSTPSKDSLMLSAKIADSSRKYTSGQMGVIVNKVKKEDKPEIINLVNAFELQLTGCIEDFEQKDYIKIIHALEDFYPRMNLPQVEN